MSEVQLPRVKRKVVTKMGKSSSALAGDQIIESCQSALFGAPPLLQGEDSVAYDDLLARVSGAVELKDIIAEIWVRDVVDLTWEIIRMRRTKASFLNSKLPDALLEIMRPLMGFVPASKLSAKWRERDPAAIQKVDQELASADLSIADVGAAALVEHFEDVEKIDHLIMIMEKRRDSALREIDRHRTALADRLRQALQSEDAEYEDVPPKDGQRRISA